MDAGEGLYQGLAALAQGIMRRRELQRQQDLIEQQKQQQGALLAALPQLFQKQVQVPATSEMARPQLGPVTGLTQPVTARGTGDLTATEPATPSLTDPKVIQYLAQAGQFGLDKPVMEAINAAQGKVYSVPAGAGLVNVKEGNKPDLLYSNPAMKTNQMRIITRDILGPNGLPEMTMQDGVKFKKVESIDAITGKSFGPSWQRVGEAPAPARPDMLQKSMLEKFNADPTVRKYTGAASAASTIKDLLDAKNPVADNSIPTFMARASGEVGNLSEADKAPFGGSSSLEQKITRTYEKATSGNLDDADRMFVYQLATVMEKSARGNVDKLARTRAAQYAKLNKMLDENELYQILSPTVGVDANQNPETNNADPFGILK